MTKQTFFISIFIIAIIGAAFWFASPFSNEASAQDTASATQEASAAAIENTENVDPWGTRCSDLKKPEGEETLKYCEMVQRIVVTKTGQQFAEFAIGYPQDADGKARGVITLPLGVLLEPVKMQIDSGQVYQFNFRYCRANGCVAVVSLTDTLIAEMKKGNKAAIQFMSAKGQNINLPITLKGFTKTIDDLKAN